jgi:hypothetical protein
LGVPSIYRLLYTSWLGAADVQKAIVGCTKIKQHGAYIGLPNALAYYRHVSLVCCRSLFRANKYYFFIQVMLETVLGIYI